MEQIKVKYSCSGCGLDKVDVEVPVREDKEDIVHWVEGLSKYLIQDHEERSPGCTEGTCDLMIPTDGRHVIGGTLIQ